MKDGRPLRDVVAVTSRIERIGGAPCAVVKEATVKGGNERAELVSFRHG